MTMLKSGNLLDHDGRWALNDSERDWDMDPVTWDSKDEAVAWAQANPGEFQTHVGQISVHTPEVLFTLSQIEGLLENALENRLDCVDDVDSRDVCEYHAGDLVALRDAVCCAARECGIVRSGYLVFRIEPTGVPDEFAQAEAAEADQEGA